MKVPTEVYSCSCVADRFVPNHGAVKRWCTQHLRLLYDAAVSRACDSSVEHLHYRDMCEVLSIDASARSECLVHSYKYVKYVNFMVAWSLEIWGIDVNIGWFRQVVPEFRLFTMGKQLGELWFGNSTAVMAFTQVMVSIGWTVEYFCVWPPGCCFIKCPKIESWYLTYTSNSMIHWPTVEHDTRLMS